MTKVLHFWRDVEIFNIPDAPRDTRRGGRGKPSAGPDAGCATGPGGKERRVPGEKIARGASYPRSPTLHSFATAARAAPALPWDSAPFQVLPEQYAEWQKRTKHDGPRMPASYAHAVYLGVGSKQRMVEHLLRGRALDSTDDELYRPATGDGWLAAFLVDGDGVPMKKTYVAASFAIGFNLLQQDRSLDATGDELKVHSGRFDDRADQRIAAAASRALCWQDLLDEWTLAHQPLGGIDEEGGAGVLGPLIVIKSVPLYADDKGNLKPAPDKAVALLNSFYIDDLTSLIQAGPAEFGCALTQYLGPDSAAADRTDLLSGAAQLPAHAGAALLTAGRWVAPPDEHLALAQQAAVYQIFDRIGQAQGEFSRGLMSVNGPPGTGKTTLLKDVVANIVVERASRLCTLREPKDLFSGALIRAAGGGTRCEAPALRADLLDGTEIVVASNNNAAVENISFEVPFSCDTTAFPGASYFPEVAALLAEKFELPRKKPWGLLAAALGPQGNRDKVAATLMGYETAYKADDPKSHPVAGTPSSLKPWLDQARRQQAGQAGSTLLQRWHAARLDFQARLADVEAVRAGLVKLEAALAELAGMAPQREALAAQLRQARGDLAAANTAESARVAACQLDTAARRTDLQRRSDKAASQRQAWTRALARLEEIKQVDDPGWPARILKKVFGFETRALKDWRTAVAQARAAVSAAEGALKLIERERDAAAAQDTQHAALAGEAAQRHALSVGQLNARIAVAAAEIEQLDARQTTLSALLAAASSGSADESPRLPDPAFLMLGPEEQHRASLWVTGKLELARGALFLSALRLHEATVLGAADEWFQLLRLVRQFLYGDIEPSRLEDRKALWHALFFVVPVVSTTLASFGRLFQGLEQETLGWVLIDEAGQAAPASVAGALWRARRALLVGDPLQIEPVVTAPRKLVESLGAGQGLTGAVLERWSPSVQSAQSLADRTAALGAMVGKVWTGLPLRTHRRCMSPMFDIANVIAYEGQMVQATCDKVLRPDLSPSAWIDVRGEASTKVVAAEIDCLRRIMETFLLDWPQVIDHKGEAKAASVYVISPFRDVAQACQDTVGDDSPLGRQFAKKKLLVAAGTVHTFQGKEASIVFLVLGSATGEAGAGSRKWASSKPNLLNVAVTRAQQRFYVIGNYADWAELSYFGEMAAGAGRMRHARLEGDAGAGHVRVVPV